MMMFLCTSAPQFSLLSLATTAPRMESSPDENKSPFRESFADITHRGIGHDCPVLRGGDFVGRVPAGLHPTPHSCDPGRRAAACGWRPRRAPETQPLKCKI